MKSFVRWSATASLVGSVLAGSLFSGVAPVRALTEDQIVEKLTPIPVFTIVVVEGKDVRPLPLMYEATTKPNGQNNAKPEKKMVPGLRFFMAKQDAQSFLDELKKKNNDLPKTAQVVSIPLAEAYRQAQQVKQKKDPAVIELAPIKQQVDAATAMLKQGGQNVNQFPGVPLFAVRFGPDKGYVPVVNQAEKKEFIPIFFTKEDAQNLLNQVKPKAAAADIQVLTMDSVIENLRKNDPWLSQVFLIPTPEGRALLQAALQNRPKQGGNSQAAPASQPAAPKK